jgi:hypothetical protein
MKKFEYILKKLIDSKIRQKEMSYKIEAINKEKQSLHRELMMAKGQIAELKVELKSRFKA